MIAFDEIDIRITDFNHYFNLNKFENRNKDEKIKTTKKHIEQHTSGYTFTYIVEE